MQTDNFHSYAPIGSYIPRNAVVVRLFLRDLTKVDEGVCGHAVPPTILDALEREGLIIGRAPSAAERRCITLGGARRYTITADGRAALADYDASLSMHPHDADDFLKLNAFRRRTRREAA